MNNNITLKAIGLSSFIFMSLLIGSFHTYADEPNIDTLLMAPEQRAKIDQQRLDYLNSKNVDEVKQEEKPPEVKTVKKTGPYKPRNPIASKIAVSAVIEKPNGERVVRVNNEFQSQSTKKIPLQFNQTTPKGAVIQDGDKTVVVPVGSTYLSQKNKVVESHTLLKPSPESNQKSRTKPERQILNADDSAVKQTLKDLQTVTAPQK
ncbi:MAG: hypothetical protein JXK16_00715 [Thiotrichales bacterium]|nr:hypothetical protein [Thiotrichales bacterium]